LICKFLLAVGSATGRVLARELCLPFGPFPELLRRMKAQQIVAYRDTAVVNDYVYNLTDAGRERAKRYLEECAYVGSAPVPFADYLESVTAQSITHERPKQEDLQRAFSDLLISRELLDQLG